MSTWESFIGTLPLNSISNLPKTTQSNTQIPPSIQPSSLKIWTCSNNCSSKSLNPWDSNLPFSTITCNLQMFCLRVEQVSSSKRTHPQVLLQVKVLLLENIWFCIKWPKIKISIITIKTKSQKFHVELWEIQYHKIYIKIYRQNANNPKSDDDCGLSHLPSITKTLHSLSIITQGQVPHWY